MGAWSGQPFGNDEAADWAWELADAPDWGVVAAALSAAIVLGADVDASTATLAIAAAEVVAAGLGRATQDDTYTEDVARFVARVDAPGPELVQSAVVALTVSSGPSSELTDLWADSDASEWRDANAAIASALGEHA